MESKGGTIRVLVFASGDPKGGGSGFQELVEFSRTNPPVLDAQIVGVISNHQNGGVRRRADALHILFEYWPGPYDAEGYRAFVRKYQADFVMCSGWLKFVRGLDPAKTVNIHPGPLPRFGGTGMYGHYVHEAVMAAYHRGEITQSAVTMHFVDDVAYDNGSDYLPNAGADQTGRRCRDTGQKSERKRTRLAKSYFKLGRPSAYLLQRWAGLLRKRGRPEDFFINEYWKRLSRVWKLPSPCVKHGARLVALRKRWERL